MRFFQRPDNPQNPQGSPQPPAEPGTPFEGAYCFGSDGFHYPVLTDADGNDLGPDKSRPLVVRGEQMLHAYPEDRNHFHQYGLQEVELQVGDE